MRIPTRVFLTWGTESFADITGRVFHWLNDRECCVCMDCMKNAGYDFRDQCDATEVWFAKNAKEFADMLSDYRMTQNGGCDLCDTGKALYSLRGYCLCQNCFEKEE